MKSTKVFEQWLQEQAQIIVRYRQVEKGDILAEYNTLKKVVESAEFQAKKKELTTTRYADTQEGKTMAEYKQLKWNTSVILYNLLKKEAYKEKPEVVRYLELAEQKSQRIRRISQSEKRELIRKSDSGLPAFFA